MRVAICEDQPAQAAYLRSLVVRWARDSREPLEIAAFDSAESFLFTYEADKSFSLLLLDIQMKAISGIDLAKRLRAEGSAMPIAFITGMAEHIGEGYEVAALHYLLKPVQEGKLREVLERARQLTAAEEPFVLLETEEGQARLLVRDILYAEAFSHDTAVRTAERVYSAKISIGELETALGLSGGFFRCHRSYLVGLRHIAHIGKTEITLDGGAVIPLSRRLYAAANKAFIAYFTHGEARK